MDDRIWHSLTTLRRLILKANKLEFGLLTQRPDQSLNAVQRERPKDSEQGGGDTVLAGGIRRKDAAHRNFSRSDLMALSRRNNATICPFSNIDARCPSQKRSARLWVVNNF